MENFQRRIVMTQSFRSNAVQNYDVKFSASSIEKSMLRKKFRRSRQLYAHNVLQHSRQICRHIGKLACFKAAKRVAIYSAYNSEVTLHSLLQSYQYQKQFALPVMLDSGGMKFIRINANTALVKNACGILEPLAIASQEVVPNDFDVVIVPGLGFDYRGGRLGQGGGYYDRLFSFKQQSNGVVSWRKPILIGVGFDFQCVGCLPVNKRDVRLDYLVSPSSGVVKFDQVAW